MGSRQLELKNVKHLTTLIIFCPKREKNILSKFNDFKNLKYYENKKKIENRLKKVVLFQCQCKIYINIPFQD